MWQFGSEAKLYDQFHENRDYAAEAVQLRRKYPTAETVLEIGAGTGLLTQAMLQQGFSVVSLEPSFSMRTQFHHRNGYAPVPLSVERWDGDYFLRVNSRDRFDLAVAHYDVLNYVPPPQLGAVLHNLHRWCKHVDLEVWDDRKGVNFCTFRRVADVNRWRFSVRLGNRVWLLFVYLGRGNRLLSLHRLYLHKGFHR